MEIDYIGGNKVADIIEQSKYSKFVIIRPNANKGSTPIFESLDSKTCAGAKDNFMNWARITDNDQPYEIILSSDKQETNAEGTKQNKTLRFSFQLKATEKKTDSFAAANQSQNINEIIENALAKQAAIYQNNELKKELGELRKEIAAREEEEDESEPLPGFAGVDVNAILSGIVTSFINKTQAQPSLGTVEDHSTNKLQTIINRLHKLDKNIVEDLDKLATLGETQPVLFNGMLASLRNM